MKALIISFFCVILGYSLFFDNEDTKVESPIEKVDITSGEKYANEKLYYISDTIEYFARQKSLINSNNFSEGFF